MKTDTLFYRLFQNYPKLALELLGIEHSGEGYRFCSEEIKQTAFRLDGLFTPPIERIDLPLIFAEVQYQPDDDFYDRLFTEICLYLRLKKPQYPWLALVIYPNRQVEKKASVGFSPFLALPQCHRVYLEDYCDIADEETLTVAMNFVRLIASDIQQTLDLANQLVAQRDVIGLEGLDFIETILVYKLPNLSREEIQKMLALNEIELKQTRFYQEIAKEERQEGRLEGEVKFLQRLLTKRFGQLPDWIVDKLKQANIDQLEIWGERVLDAVGLENIFE
jgi:predicted transposase/invertase (TIGR01784 family)